MCLCWGKPRLNSVCYCKICKNEEQRSSFVLNQHAQSLQTNRETHNECLILTKQKIKQVRRMKQALTILKPVLQNQCETELLMLTQGHGFADHNMDGCGNHSSGFCLKSFPFPMCPYRQGCGIQFRICLGLEFKQFLQIPFSFLRKLWHIFT